jgi:Tfp pilus assembly protein PilO
MIRLSKREKFLFILTATVILSSLIYRGILEPTVKKWRYLNRQIGLKQARLAKNLKIIAQEAAVRREFSRYRDFIFPRVSDEEEIARLLREVEKLARESGVHITDMAPRNKEQNGLYEQFSIELETEASMVDLMRFIFALENSRFLFATEKIKISLKSSRANVLKSNLLLTKISF